MRLKRFRVDDLKRRMTTLDGMRSDLERKLADLEDSIARERQRANDSDIGRLAFPSFLRSIEVRRENLRATLKEIDRCGRFRALTPRGFLSGVVSLRFPVCVAGDHMSLSERIAPLIGRLAIAWLFLSEAWTMINSWDGTVTLLQMRHMPAAPLLLVVALSVMILGGISIAVGYHTRHGALLLFGFTVIVSVIMHDYWKLNEAADRLADSEIFMRNMAIAGGLLLLMGMGAGPFAIDNVGGSGKRGR